MSIKVKVIKRLNEGLAPAAQPAAQPALTAQPVAQPAQPAQPATQAAQPAANGLQNNQQGGNTVNPADVNKNIINYIGNIVNGIKKSCTKDTLYAGIPAIKAVEADKQSPVAQEASKLVEAVTKFQTEIAAQQLSVETLTSAMQEFSNIIGLINAFGKACTEKIKPAENTQLNAQLPAAQGQQAAQPATQPAPAAQ